MSEVVGGGGWSRRITRLRAESFTREQARQESNLRLPHLFPPFLCISTELQFIQILLNELFCIYLCYTQRILSIFFKKVFPIVVKNIELSKYGKEGNDD